MGSGIEIGDSPCVWTDGGREDYSTGGFEVAGSGVYLLAPELAMEGAVWGTVEEYGDARLDRCRAFMPVPGSLRRVHRAEFRGTIWLCRPSGLGIDCLNVVRSVGCLTMAASLTLTSGKGW